jgi:large subunit ribosomal protein L21
MVAVIATSGTQLRVSEGDTVVVDRINAEVGSTIELDRVLILGSGADIKIGSPTVDGAKVEAEVIAHGKGHKRDSYRYRRTRSYRRSMGFRPSETTLTITKITG